MVAAGPDNFVQSPVPGLGSVAAKVIVEVPVGWHWSGPALACAGPGIPDVIICMVSENAESHAFFICHTK
jgi:hypothetical protein